MIEWIPRSDHMAYARFKGQFYNISAPTLSDDDEIKIS